MKFRVAIFKRAKNKLEFYRLAYSGYKMTQDGVLIKGNKVCNTTDKRAKVFYEVNYLLPKLDRLGQQLYEHDIIFDSRFNALSVLLWNKSGCAFVLANRSRKMVIKYRYCDFRDSVEKVGNEYENILNQISAKGFTK